MAINENGLNTLSPVINHKQKYNQTLFIRITLEKKYVT